MRKFVVLVLLLVLGSMASAQTPGRIDCGNGDSEAEIFDIQRPLLTDTDGNQLSPGEEIRVNGFKIEGILGDTYIILL